MPQFRLVLLLGLLCFLLQTSLQTDSKANPTQTTTVPRLKDLNALAKYHCLVFPVEILFRLSAGRLAQQYGPQWADIDCYVRQYINKDGQNLYSAQDQNQESQNQDQDAQHEDQDNSSEQSDDNQQNAELAMDPIVEKYAEGLSQCLPAEVNKAEAVYAIWRFFRFLVQHDYLYELMRSMIRATIGYEAEKPGSWMDGERNAGSVRLEKLYSNEFYKRMDTMMFKKFLHPAMTFFRHNVVVAVQSGKMQNKRPILIQSLMTRQLSKKVFWPAIINVNGKQVFTYTMPGLPLLLSGASSEVAWAFTGILLDRTNIEQIETVGSKYYHFDSEMWHQLSETTETIPVLGQQSRMCSYNYSMYGPLLEKNERDGKITEYIIRWHEDEKRVRMLFSGVWNMVSQAGNIRNRLEFPFNSLVLVNKTGVHHYMCPIAIGSYFLYPDIPAHVNFPHSRWMPIPKRGILVVANNHLSTIKQEAYVTAEPISFMDDLLTNSLRRALRDLKEFSSANSVYNLVLNQLGSTNDDLSQERLTTYLQIYRKIKYAYYPNQSLRIQCDQLINLLDKWSKNMEANEDGEIVFKLWEWKFRDNLFSVVSSEHLGRDIPRHHLLTERYWNGQLEREKEGISYGECETDTWTEEVQAALNGTGVNSTCFWNLMTSLNFTRLAFIDSKGHLDISMIQTKLRHKESTSAVAIEIENQNYIGSPIDEALGRTYTHSISFVAQIGSGKITFDRNSNAQVGDWIEEVNVSEGAFSQL